MEDISVRKESKDYSWAVFLIFSGILLLLNTTKIISWEIWSYIVRFWPIFIILIGIRFILGRSRIANIFSFIITIFLMISVFGVSYVLYSSKGIPYIPDSVNQWILKGGDRAFNLNPEKIEKQITVDLEEFPNIEQRSIELNIGASEFQIVDEGTEEYMLVQAEYPEGFKEHKIESTEVDDVLNINFESANPIGFHMWSSESSYVFRVGQPDILTSFDINLGAGDGSMNLSTLQVDNLYAEVGAGKLSVSFEEKSVPSGQILLNIGAGAMILEIPSGVGYQIGYDLGVGKIKIGGKDISDSLDTNGKYESENYATAKIKMIIEANVGVGSLSVENK